MTIEGIRVVRGRDWSLGDSDGGEGHVGTVIKVNPDHSVEVQWDMGEKTTCITGKGDKCDLRVFDSSPAGVRHNGIKCNAHGCGRSNFLGTRWRCANCTGFDLCSLCYFKDKHSIQHPFFRYDTPGMSGESVGKRSSSDRRRSWGTFEDATVKRGPDWNYGDQDGGESKTGTVVQLQKWSNSRGSRNGVLICWSNNYMDSYRLGYNGKVDMICVEAAPGTDYYRDHLLLLSRAIVARRNGIPTVSERNLMHFISTYTRLVFYSPDTVNLPMATELQTSKVTEVDCQTFKKGDKVCILLPELKEKGHDDCSMCLTEFNEQHGVVKNVADNGDVVVTFGDREWQLYSGVVIKVPALKVGDKVRILDNKDKIQALQKRHGGWATEMTPTLGNVGKVVMIDSDGDVAVAFGGTAIVYNAACCIPVEVTEDVDVITDYKTATGSDEVGGSRASEDNEDKDDDSDQLTRLMAQLPLHNELEKSQAAGPKHFISAAASNDARVVKAIMEAQPDIVNVKYLSLTALIIASHRGYTEVVRVLLQGKADLDVTDDRGNTALMAALMKKRQGIAEMLMDAGANVNMVNRNKMNALHQAALARADHSLLLLISKNGNVNQQDSDGDTPMHCAILKKNNSSVAILLTAPTIDVTLCNNNGHNHVRLASMEDDELSLSNVLAKAPELLNTPSKDGYTPMHVGADNNSTDVLKTLIQEKAEIDPCDDQQMTPLHMACFGGHLNASTLLVESGASLSVSDNDGDTALHKCLMGRKSRCDTDLLVRMVLFTAESVLETVERIKLACFLIEQGADVTVTNNRDKRPLQCGTNDQLRDTVKQFADSGSQTQQWAGTAELEQDIFTMLRLPCIGDDCDNMTDTVFKPCGHKICCRQCSVKEDKCQRCDKHISARQTLDGQTIAGESCKVP